MGPKYTCTQREHRAYTVILIWLNLNLTPTNGQLNLLYARPQEKLDSVCKFKGQEAEERPVKGENLVISCSITIFQGEWDWGVMHMVPRIAERHLERERTERELAHLHNNSVWLEM